MSGSRLHINTRISIINKFNSGMRAFDIAFHHKVNIQVVYRVINAWKQQQKDVAPIQLGTSITYKCICKPLLNNAIKVGEIYKAYGDDQKLVRYSWRNVLIDGHGIVERSCLLLIDE